MFSFVVTAALALCFRGTSAIPQTLSPNSTTTYSLGPQITKAPAGNCSNDCVYTLPELSYIQWSQLSITATYIAETVVFVVNKKNNSTRTTTISNTEIDFGKIATPTNLNSDGTVTASVVDNDGSTRIVAYPTTVYGDYAKNVSWTGTLSSIVSGIPTCLIAPTGTVAVYPSHPLLPEAVQTDGVDVAEDPRGWTFIAKWESCGDASLVENFFPGFGVWNCSVVASCASPYVALQTALYLTKTSTSTEPDDSPTSTEATALSTHSSVAHTERPTSADTPISSTRPAEIPPSTEKTSSEILPAQAPSGLGGSEVPSSVHGPVPSITPSQNFAIAGPLMLEPASELLPTVIHPPASISKSIVITPLPAQATVLSTTPVAVLKPITSTDSKGGITISTSTAVVHPVIASSTNAQGSTVLSTSLSTLSISASLPYVITSTDAQGNVVSSTAHLPAIILTTTNTAGSESLTTSPLSLATPPVSAIAPITINGDTITPNAHSYIISSQTLTPGGSITLGSGTSTTLLALQTSSGSTALIYGPHTSPIPSAPGTTPGPLTIGTETITPDSRSQYIISGSTLSAGGSSITLGSGSSTTVLALQTSGSETALVYAPSTSVLTPVLPLPTNPPAITIGSDTITANSETQYVIGSQTLTAGGVVTVSGTRVSLAAGESDVVVGSSTEALAPYITAGFGTGTNGTGVQIFTGGAKKRFGSGWGRRELWMVGLGAVVLMV